MKKTSKKLLSLALAAVMALAILPAGALAADSDWTINEYGVLTKYTGSDSAITLPDRVTEIWPGAFAGCTNLTSIQVGTGNQTYTSADGVVFTKDKRALVAYPTGRQGAYTIPDGVTEIDGSAFYGCTGLTGVTIPNSVTGIYACAFSGCTGLTGIAIPGSVTLIRMEAFSGCTGLTSVTIPGSVTELDEDMFSGCTGLTSVTISSGVPQIGLGMFSGCTALTSVIIPDSVTAIHDGAFSGCTSLKDIYYGGSEAQWEAMGTSMSGDFRDEITGITVHCNSAGPGTSAQPAAGNAIPTNDALTVDGKSVTPAAYKIGNANFFKLRDVAMMLSGTAGQFSVDYDGDLKAVKIVTGQPYTPQGQELKDKPTATANAEISNNAIYINGEKVELTVYKINGQNFFGIRDLGSRLGFNVGWEPGRGMFIESDKPYDPNN